MEKRRHLKAIGRTEEGKQLREELFKEYLIPVYKNNPHDLAYEAGYKDALLDIIKSLKGD